MKVELKYKHLISKLPTIEYWEHENEELLNILLIGRLRFLGYATRRSGSIIKIIHIKNVETGKRHEIPCDK